MLPWSQYEKGNKHCWKMQLAVSTCTCFIIIEGMQHWSWILACCTLENKKKARSFNFSLRRSCHIRSPCSAYWFGSGFTFDALPDATLPIYPSSGPAFWVTGEMGIISFISCSGTLHKSWCSGCAYYITVITTVKSLYKCNEWMDEWTDDSPDSAERRVEQPQNFFLHCWNNYYILKRKYCKIKLDIWILTIS